jgi:hypothetical protein
VISALICWYSGEKVGDAPEGATEEGAAGDPAAPPVLTAAGLLFELGGAGFIGQDFTTKAPCRPAKTRNNLSVLYKT